MRLNDSFKMFRPAGSIQTIDELLALMKEANETGENITIYLVGQLGSIQLNYLTKDSKPDSFVSTIDGRSIKSVITKVKYISSDDYYNGNIHFSSYNITEDGNFDLTYGEIPHFAFTNKMHAENYSNVLKNSEEHKKDVKKWHDHCNRIDSIFDDLFDSIFDDMFNDHDADDDEV